MYDQFSLVSQLCLNLCNPMDCSMPGFPVHHQLPELTQTHVHWWCHPTISSSVIPFSSCLQSFPASGSFQMSQFFASGSQSIGASAWASVLPMNIQDWFPLGFTGLILLQSKELSRVFSNTTVRKQQVRMLMIRVYLPKQGTRVQSLVQEDSTYCRITKLTQHSYRAYALEPASCNFWAHMMQLLKPTCPRVCAPQQESHCNEKPMYCNKEKTFIMSCLQQLEKAHTKQ